MNCVSLIARGRVANMLKKHATTVESFLAQQPTSTEASAQNTDVTNLPNLVLAGGRSPDDCLN